MKLSKNFSLNEITRSSTAIRKGINNNPNEEHLYNIKILINEIVQPMRDDIGPIRISSGYRSPQLNRAIGGSNKSQHCKGQALDLQYWEKGKMNNEVIYDWILSNEVEFDQIINEFNFAWIHISYNEGKNRQQVLEAFRDKDGDVAYKFADDIPKYMER